MPLMLALALTLAARVDGPRDFAFHHEGVIGTFLELRVSADSEAAARRAEHAVLAAIDRLAAVFSGYDPASDFSRWLARRVGPVAVPAELFDLFAASEHWTATTGGAFDPRAEAVGRLWHEAERTGFLPDEQAIQAALAAVRAPAWRLDPIAKTATRTSDGPLTFDAIATGTIVDAASRAALEVEGVHGLLVNLGGDLAAWGEMTTLVAIPDPAAEAEYSTPLAVLNICDRAVTTSGRSDRDFKIGGQRFSHIIDPRTGRPADQVASATVVAPTCEAADALATAFAVLTVQESLHLAASMPQVECLIVAATGEITESSGWAALAAPIAPQPEGGAEPAFEMLVRVEINKPAGANPYRRPYLAVWLEDEKGFPVRTISLLVSFGGPGPKWINDLKRWYKSDKERLKIDKTDRLYTVSKSTRPPGRFEMVWDGKDDQGKVLPDGAYTLYIEAAREHGTYQLIRVPVTFEGKPFTADPEGNVEVKSAHVEYRSKAARP